MGSIETLEKEMEELKKDLVSSKKVYENAREQFKLKERAYNILTGKKSRRKQKKDNQ